MKFNSQSIMYWRMKFKKIQLYIKGFLKIVIKKIKIEIKLILYLTVMWNWKKNEFTKRTKKIKKNETQNWHKNKNNVCD